MASPPAPAAAPTRYLIGAIPQPVRVSASASTSHGGAASPGELYAPADDFVVLRMRIDFGKELRTEVNGQLLASAPITLALAGLTGAETESIYPFVLGSQASFVLGSKPNPLESLPCGV